MRIATFRGRGMRWPLGWRSGDPFTWAKRLLADGEIAWSWRRDPGVYPACLCGLGNGDNKGRSPGRSRISRKPVARGRPGCLGCTCQTRVRLFPFFAHGAAGAVGAWLSPRPLLTERANEDARPGRKPVAGMRTHVSLPSLRAKCSSLSLRAITANYLKHVIPGWCESTRPQMRNCASGNREIPGSMPRIAPETTASEISRPPPPPGGTPAAIAGRSCRPSLP
jgi:hypothetical protein